MRQQSELQACTEYPRNMLPVDMGTLFGTCRFLRMAFFWTGVAFTIATSGYAAENVFELVPVDDGVYAAIVVPEPPTYVFANALVVVGTDAVLVVDTQQSLLPARELIAKIARLTQAPVRYVVNTHWHGDHVYGNEVYRERFADVRIIGHETMRQDMLEKGAAYLEQERLGLPESIRERERWLSSNVGPNGEALTPELRAAVEYSVSARSRYWEDLQVLDLTPPDFTFVDELEVDLGGRVVLVRHLGPAHTRGDVIVYLPREGVVAVGDLLEDGFPYFGDSFPSGWARALDAIGDLGARVLLPSHGPILRDRTLLDTETRLLRTLVDGVQEGVSLGLSLDKTRERVRLSLSEFEDTFASSSFADLVAPAVERAYLEATGVLSASTER